MRRRLHIGLRLIALGALAVAGAGCFNPFSPRVAAQRGFSEPAPAPTSARNALELFRWCWEHRAYEEYRQLFTEDYRFFSAYVDPDDPDSLSGIQTRDDELASARHLFIGGKADEPPANRIVLDFSSDLVAIPDSRPGKTYPWHQVIQTSVTLSVDTDNESFRVTGDARFFLVRGDSAVIPPDLGADKDETRFYIERWEDFTGGGSLAAVALERMAARGTSDARAASPAVVAARSRSAGGADGTVRPAPPGVAAARPEAAHPFQVSWKYLKRLYR
jgi:hypothetical protein